MIVRAARSKLQSTAVSASVMKNDFPIFCSVSVFAIAKIIVSPLSLCNAVTMNGTWEECKGGGIRS